MVLLSFMYATGTRAQEVCDLTVKSVNFRSTGTTIDIVGKGFKMHVAYVFLTLVHLCLEHILDIAE
mgnify:CR=1 FL=1